MRTAILFSVVAAIVSGAAFSAELGDPAAPLDIAAWVKGDPVSLEVLRGKQPVVVEFWATWCPPCRASIPHLTELQKKYEGKVVFVGVSDEAVEEVKPFVEEQGDAMGYRVAVDAGKTSEGYMEAYGIRGIPHAFVVDREGRMVYEAHPMDPEMETVLDLVVAGEFDPERLKQEREEQKRREEKVERYFALAGDGDEAAADALGSELAALFADAPPRLNSMAWQIGWMPDLAYRDLELALRMAEQACAASEHKSPAYLDTKAGLLSMLGRIEEAVTVQEKAIELAEDNFEKASLFLMLQKYKKGFPERSAASSQ